MTETKVQIRFTDQHRFTFSSAKAARAFLRKNGMSVKLFNTKSPQAANWPWTPTDLTLRLNVFKKFVKFQDKEIVKGLKAIAIASTRKTS